MYKLSNQKYTIFLLISRLYFQENALHVPSEIDPAYKQLLHIFWSHKLDVVITAGIS